MEQEHVKEEIKQIYRAHYNDVYKFLVAFTNTRNESEDLTQEVFIRLFKSLPKFKGESHLKTWIFSIARHVAIDHSKKCRRQQLVSDIVLKFMPSKEKTTEELVEAKEEIDTVYASLKKFKYEYRMVIILRGIQEFSVKETAQIMNWSESKVKVNYHRALKQLKQELQSDTSLVSERWV
ncbi:RNA polymerase sigma factor [Alkalihalobacterium chitinilyticum]|uniref:RNA polymerase sigma factor n=1 Tax=Alkalihalobacterium chitinilyticum TaxID=2980103 RepID=A0ABT5VBM0_9BACI|nr:RNA polymerase sigma factor [Alkalihalobacterium chitinilyticum]MDE5412742.1 RNA polymerase sigma factor [Alkalihalobacterium chitinilyticum]